MTNDILITGANVLGEGAQDILISNGHIVEIAPSISADAAQKIDAKGLIALPGLIDLHTHLREPGFEQSETVLTGSRAAAAGGFTTVFAMANTNPVADSAGVVEQVQRLGDEAGFVTVRPVGAVTVGLAGESLSDIGAMANSRAQVRVFSDDGKCVHDSLLMRRALEYVKTFDGVIAQHAQDPRLTVDAQMNEGEVSARLGLNGWPAVAEESIIARDVLLAEHVGSRIHICHLSTAGSVEIVRWAKARGIQVTAEVTPHHLLLTDDLAENYDARFKVNPPLRSQADVLALRAAVADGTIDIVATDHAPHPHDSKDCEWDQAAFGMVGLESALPIVNTTLVESGLLSWADVARVLSETPAKIGSLASGGTLAQGDVADIVLFDPAVTRVWSTDDVVSRSKNTPFTGVELKGAISYTIRHGYFTVFAGEVVDDATVASDALAVARG
jgi:dihydroorotase